MTNLIIVSVTAFLAGLGCLPLVAQNLVEKTIQSRSPYLKVEIISVNKIDLNVKVSITNTLSQAIYLTTEPVDRLAKNGFYLSQEASDRNELVISSQIYPPPIPSPFRDGTGIMLRKLMPNDVFEQNIVVSFPAKETMPPRGTVDYHFENGKPVLDSDAPSFPRLLELEKFTSVRISFGYFLYNQSIEQYLIRNPKGRYIHALDIAEIGKQGKPSTFFDLQNIVSAKLCIKDIK